MSKCQHKFANNTKCHKKGDLCNITIRKENVNYCWKHKLQQKEESLTDIPEESGNESKDKHVTEIPKESGEESKPDFIQLINS